MSRAHRQARRIRRLILVGGIVYALAAVGWLLWPLFESTHPTAFYPSGLLGTPFIVHEIQAPEYAVEILLFLALILLAQWAFLRPARGWTVRVALEGHPLRRAVGVAAFMAALLTAGAVALVLELPDWWAVSANEPANYLGLWLVFLLIWGVWIYIFARYWRDGDEYTRLGRMIRGLVAGSLLEVLVAVPVHLAVMRTRECYCRRGTYTTLIFAGTVLLWAFGPGILLLYARERYRRNRLFPVCELCEYDLRGDTAGRCPECGVTRVQV
jgi:hypothetical protein